MKCEPLDATRGTRGVGARAVTGGQPRSVAGGGSDKAEAPGGLAQLEATEACLSAAGEAAAGSMVACSNGWGADVCTPGAGAGAIR